MLRHSQYVALFRDLATRHQKIQHSPKVPRFARVVVSIDPFQKQVDLAEMAEKQLGRHYAPGSTSQMLVVESCHTQYLDNGGDNRQRRRSGAFYVFQKLPKDFTQDDIELAIDATEETGEQLLAAVLHALAGQVKVRLDEKSISADTIGPIGDGSWYGTRFDFDFTNPATAALTYNPAAFI
ncbi:hypothetical protein [Hymenobacter psychrotolerans]|uniref:Uncharacterized protein n=1 Tax=Hymenobacter psychrotolerans DSM 18569 TaxID=1121959 RepID=A0A1M7E8C9_9BACT|nr:hypothetical protein [Hymenobacter psychrotolerans]SHL87973.1 hypothetical protein SAMN02746009_03550 [Hymenobacter psychrotolerans DSM 18569]